MEPIEKLEAKLDIIIEKLETKTDIVIAKQHENNIILALNTSHLEQHMKRTSMLEARVEPIETAYKQANGIIKLFTFLSLLAVIVDVTYRLLKKS